MEAQLAACDGELTTQLQLAATDGRERLRALQRERLAEGRLGAHGGKTAIGLLHQLAVGIDREFARQRVVVGPSHLVVGLRGQFVGHDAEEQRLAVLLIDGGREQTVAVAADAAQFEVLHAGGIGREGAVAANGAYPAEGAHAGTGVLRCAGEEVAAVCERRDVGHLPEGAMLVAVAALEENLAVVGPLAVLQLVQRAGTDTILARAHDDVLLAVSREVVGVAEVVGESRRAAVDDNALLRPVKERSIGRCGMGDDGTGVVDGGI